MVNGPPFEHCHSHVRTTKGKDLDKVADFIKLEHLTAFKMLIQDYIGGVKVST